MTPGGEQRVDPDVGNLPSPALHGTRSQRIEPSKPAIFPIDQPRLWRLSPSPRLRTPLMAVRPRAYSANPPSPSGGWRPQKPDFEPRSGAFVVSIDNLTALDQEKSLRMSTLRGRSSRIDGVLRLGRRTQWRAWLSLAT